MDIRTIKILAIEDDEEDLFLLRMILQRGSGAHFDIQAAKTLGDGLARLGAGDIDVVLLDLSLPDSKGLDTFREVKAAARNVPVIVLSGVDEETMAVNALHAGAEEYLVKGRVDSQLITRAITYAIERAEARKVAAQAEERYRSIFENSVSGIFQTTPEGRYLDVNPALVRMYGYSSPADLMSAVSDIGRLLYVAPNRRTDFVRLMHEKGVVQDFESQIFRKDGTIIWISENARAVRDSKGEIKYFEGMVEDITARKEAEEKLRFSETRFRSVWQNSTDGMRLTDEQGVILAVNRSFCNIVGMASEELVGRPFTVIYGNSEIAAEMMQKYQQRFAQRAIESQIERRVTFRSGREADVELSNSFIDQDEGRVLVLSVFRDITIRKQAEERERKINAELARSQAELRKKNEIMEEDLKMARETQQAILPAQYPAFPPGSDPSQTLLRFCHTYLPTGQVGGDFFNVLALAPTKAGLFICDVMGHGVRSALVTGMVRALVEELRPLASDPGQLLTRLNCDLRAILRPTGTPLFTTAFYLVADLESRQVLYSNAGHPKPFLIHRKTGEVETLANDDGKSRPALGLFDQSTYPTARRPMSAGDVVMLFTDGLYEVEGANNEQFSPEQLLEAVRKNAKLHCEDLFSAILNEVSQFSATHEFTDDVCMVGVEAAENF